VWTTLLSCACWHAADSSVLLLCVSIGKPFAKFVLFVRAIAHQKRIDVKNNAL